MNIKAPVSRLALKKFICIFLSFALFCLSLAVLSVAAYYFDLNYELMRVISYVLMSLFLFTASFFTAYFSVGAGWLNGALAAVIYLAFILLMSLCVNGSQCDVAGFLIRAPLFVVGGLVSGMIGINCSH